MLVDGRRAATRRNLHAGARTAKAIAIVDVDAARTVSYVVTDAIERDGACRACQSYGSCGGDEEKERTDQSRRWHSDGGLRNEAGVIRL